MRKTASTFRWNVLTNVANIYQQTAKSKRLTLHSSPKQNRFVMELILSLALSLSFRFACGINCSAPISFTLSFNESCKCISLAMIYYDRSSFSSRSLYPSTCTCECTCMCVCVGANEWAPPKMFMLINVLKMQNKIDWPELMDALYVLINFRWSEINLSSHGKMKLKLYYLTLHLFIQCMYK